ncbi:hypothetical protein B7463_g3391, partial [Scytalidium lignicola]
MGEADIQTSPALAGISQECFGFPKQNGRSLSYWLQGVRCDPLLDHRSTPELPLSADIVIIGSGPGKSVVVLEAREFCSSATGRNAGHCKPDQYRGFSRYEKVFGTEQALKVRIRRACHDFNIFDLKSQILQNEQQTWSDLVQYVRENNVDCDLWVGDTLDVPVTQEVADITKDSFDRLKAAGGKVDHIKVTHDPAEAAKISRIKDAKACYAWSASTLQPWKLVAHIMRDNLKKGVNLQTYTTVTQVKSSLQSPGKWIVESQRGSIECSQVVHATNAYSSALEPSLHGIIRPTPHMCVKIVPPVTFAGSKGLKNSYAVLLPDGALFSINPRCTADGIVMFGGSNPGQQKFNEWLEEHPESCIDDGLTGFNFGTQAVQEFTESQFPGWTDAATGPGELYDYTWSGIIARSADGVPLVGQLPGLPGQWICAGHNGHGMARTFTAAPGLVKLMDGKPWRDTQLPDVYQITSKRIEELKHRKFVGNN